MDGARACGRAGGASAANHKCDKGLWRIGRRLPTTAARVADYRSIGIPDQVSCQRGGERPRDGAYLPHRRSLRAVNTALTAAHQSASKRDARQTPATRLSRRRPSALLMGASGGIMQPRGSVYTPRPSAGAPLGLLQILYSCLDLLPFLALSPSHSYRKFIYYNLQPFLDSSSRCILSLLFIPGNYP